MGADQQFCLRWNNFHTNITSAFESLRDDEDFVDITLACEGRQVKAHKMVLSACSPYFRSLLKGNPCQHPIVFLKDVTFANLASILDFMYHGEVNVSHNELATFLKTAEALKVRGLAEDDKKKDSDGYMEASSPGPTRDPADPSSPRPDETSATDTHNSDSPPPYKKQRRRSGASVQSAEDNTNETVISELRETSVKNEPQEFNDDEEMLGHSSVDAGDIKTDNTVHDENDERNNFGISESVTISRSQAAMQQLQESFGSFLPSMSQSSGFLPHGATEMPRPPFPLEGVQGLPPGISALPGPSMSQAGASQDTSQDEATSSSTTTTTMAGTVKRDPAHNSLSNPTTTTTTSSSASSSSSGRLPPETPFSTSSGSGSLRHHQQHQYQQQQHQHQHRKHAKLQQDICTSFSALQSFEDSLLSREKSSSDGGLSSSSLAGLGFNAVSGADADILGFGPRTPQRPVTGDEMQCGVCGRMLCNKYVLKVHMRDVHTPRSMHQCPLCGRCYSTINSLRVHISTIHKTISNP